MKNLIPMLLPLLLTAPVLHAQHDLGMAILGLANAHKL